MKKPTLPAWRWFALAGTLLIISGAAGLLANGPTWLPPSPSALAQAPTPPAPTPTPFQPRPPGRAYLPAMSAAAELQPDLPAQPGGNTSAGLPAEHFARELLDFPAVKAVLRLGPVAGLNDDKNIRIAFTPAADCPLNSGKACVTAHRAGQVILLTVHSGGGGQGEAFRAAVEGAGLDTAAFSLARIRANLALLAGAPADYKLGAGAWLPLRLAAVTRIPPAQVETYMRLPVDDALRLVSEIDPAARAALDSGQPLLLFEICGWYLPGEDWSPGETLTSASIYLGFALPR